MKSAAELQDIALEIESILNKPENQTSLTIEDALMLTALINKAGKQYLNLPFKTEPLSLAAQNGNNDLLSLLQNCYLPLIHADPNIENAVHFNIYEFDRVLTAIEVAKPAALIMLSHYILSNGDPLFVACYAGDVQKVNLLLPAYAKLSRENNQIYDHVIAAVEAASPEIRKIFLKNDEIAHLTKAPSSGTKYMAVHSKIFFSNISSMQCDQNPKQKENPYSNDKDMFFGGRHHIPEPGKEEPEYRPTRLLQGPNSTAQVPRAKPERK